MTDRELLELAAKAAGLTVRWHSDSHYGPTMEVMEDESGGAPWNPLTDDGDALRLAVHAERFLMVDFWSHVIALRGTLDFLDSPAESTRRAIVRAAAEIERNMK